MFLGSKTTRRTRDEAWRDVEQMMKRLNVANFDLFQLHSVGTIPELDKATASGGALETLIEMRRTGLDPMAGHHRTRPPRVRAQKTAKVELRISGASRPRRKKTARPKSWMGYFLSNPPSRAWRVISLMSFGAGSSHPSGLSIFAVFPSNDFSRLRLFACLHCGRCRRAGRG